MIDSMLKAMTISTPHERRSSGRNYWTTEATLESGRFTFSCHRFGPTEACLCVVHSVDWIWFSPIHTHAAAALYSCLLVLTARGVGETTRRPSLRTVKHLMQENHLTVPYHGSFSTNHTTLRAPPASDIGRGAVMYKSAVVNRHDGKTFESRP
ncbi:hypothetical protein EJ06DRAFT_323374 [Trichodelitschia bisporula]|uniref:Uncharacterized protein n=1 Tax=Trichodelitschia bisporula TaxID=703511 RepID=A0A6G1I518_9PEZI|nr:hypothetical protein EJ06DRAFT_323374 [Trichodelitschia bisporula]